MSIKKAAIQHREEREKEQLDDLSRKIDVIDVTIEDLEAALKHNKQLTPQGRTAIELKIETFKKKKDRLKTKLEKAQTQSVSYDDPRKRAGNHKQRIAKSNLVVISDQTATAEPIFKIELEQKPQERNLGEEKPRNDQPSDKGLGVSESDKNKDSGSSSERVALAVSTLNRLEEVRKQAEQESREALSPVDVGTLYIIWKMDKEKKYSPYISQHLKTLYPQGTEKGIPNDATASFDVIKGKTSMHVGILWWKSGGERKWTRLGKLKEFEESLGFNSDSPLDLQWTEFVRKRFSNNQKMNKPLQS